MRMKKKRKREEDRKNKKINAKGRLLLDRIEEVRWTI